MSISKTIITQEGVPLGFHKVVQVSWNLASSGDTVCVVQIKSWPNMQAYTDGATALQNQAMRLPSEPSPEKGMSMFEAAERLMILDESSDLWGGTYSESQSVGNELTKAQAARCDYLKMCRAAAISQNLPTPYGTFLCGPVDRTSITDGVLFLQTLAGMGMPTTLDFTLANDTTVNLSTAQMIEVGLLLAQRVQTAHATSRLLRLDILNATTVAEVAAVVWPT